MKLKIDRFLGTEINRTESVEVPKLLTPAIKEIKAYQKALRQLKKSEGNLHKIQQEAIKSNDINDLIYCGDFLTRLHLMSGRFFYEKIYRLEDKQKKKKKK